MLTVPYINYSKCGIKRKYSDHIILTTNKKIKHIENPPNLYKRKLQLPNPKEHPKKQKTTHIYCIFHFEKYICDIYECSSIKHDCKNETHMPYIN